MIWQKSVFEQKTRQRSDVFKGQIWERGRPYWATGISLSGYSSPTSCTPDNGRTWGKTPLCQVHPLRYPPWMMPLKHFRHMLITPTAHMRLRTKHGMLLFTEILIIKSLMESQVDEKAVIDRVCAETKDHD